MGRDTYRYRALDAQREKRAKLDPIWRGVGCIMIVFFAVLGFALTGWFIKANAVNNWIYIPNAMMNPTIFPAIDSYLGNGLLVKVVIAILVVVFSYGILSTIYAVAFPYVPSEVDAPPPKKVKRKRR